MGEEHIKVNLGHVIKWQAKKQLQEYIFGLKVDEAQLVRTLDY